MSAVDGRHDKIRQPGGTAQCDCAGDGPHGENGNAGSRKVGGCSGCRWNSLEKFETLEQVKITTWPANTR
jgi:hypothetical protein